VSATTPPPENSGRATPFQIFEDSFSILALSLMTVLPVIEMVSRQFRWPGIPGSAVVVQQLTLWIGMLGGMLASRSGRLLGLSSSGFLPESWIAPAKVFWGAALAAVSTCLAYASWVFVRTERESGSYLLPGLPKWTALAIMLVGFAVIAIRAVWNASANWKGRAIAALGLFIPALFGYVIPIGTLGVLPLSFALLTLATVLGLPIFAVFGGLALLLFWNSSTPVASVPVEMYRLVASP
jgi:TRAP-type C4-dicarboxylate transport system permease small subunit